MPTRSRSHVLEDLSRAEFSRLLTGPLGWVVRDVTPDYGIDVEVEIFDDDGSTTGLTFKAQLKGMQQPDQLGPWRDLKVEHLRYWGRFDVPVLLVAYDDSSKGVYGRWIHALDLDLAPGQETVRIRFSDVDRIVAGDPRLRETVEVVRRIKSGGFGRPYLVRIEGSAGSGQAHQHFAIVRGLGLEDFIKMDRSAFAFTVSITEARTRVALPADVGSMTVTYEGRTDATERARDSFVLLASLLVRMNRFGEAIQMVSPLVGQAPALHVPEVAIELATAAYELGDHGTLIRLLRESLDNEAVDAAQIYFMVLRQVPGNTWAEATRQQLESSIQHCIESASAVENTALAARWAYNFAQFLFEKKARSEARIWIELALRLDPAGYGSRPEPQRLLGGIAWFDGAFEESVLAYQSAVEWGGLEAAGSQLADSLMHAGRYEEARDLIGQVLDAGADNWRDIFVDAILDEVVEHLHLNTQERTAFPPEGTKLSGRLLTELQQFLIQGDALNPSVWLALCLEHPIERVTTLMAGAYLSNDLTLLTMAVHGLLHAADQPRSAHSLEFLAHLLCDHPEAKHLLLSDDVPKCDGDEQELISEIALRSLEILPRPPGVQLVDENNIVLEQENETH